MIFIGNSPLFALPVDGVLKNRFFGLDYRFGHFGSQASRPYSAPLLI
jgi:hypothetical protein